MLYNIQFYLHIQKKSSNFAPDLVRNRFHSARSHARTRYKKGINNRELRIPQSKLNYSNTINNKYNLKTTEHEKIYACSRSCSLCCRYVCR